MRKFKIDEIMRTSDYERSYAYMQRTQDVMEVLELARRDAGIRFAADDEAVVEEL